MQTEPQRNGIGGPAKHAEVSPRTRAAGSDRHFTDLTATLATVGKKRAWRYEGAIEGAPIAVWVAPEKGNKSFAAIQMGVATVTGSKWLGAFECLTPGAVLYLDAEYGAHEFARRLARISRGMGHRPEDVARQIHHLYSRDLVLHHEDTAARWVLTQTERIKPALIVIDPWRNHLPGEENSAEDTKWALNIVAQLRDATGAVVLLPHHLNRAGTYSGSRALLGRADLIFEGSDCEVPLYSTKGRTIRRDDPIAKRFSIQVDHDDDHDDSIARTRVSLRFEGDPVSKTNLSKVALRVLGALRSSPRPLKSNDLKRATGVTSGTAIKSALAELNDAGVARPSPQGWSPSTSAFFDGLRGEPT